MKVLCVIDMQNDFVFGSLGTKEAQDIIPFVCQKVRQCYADENYGIVYTLDTHDAQYKQTQEGRLLPVRHCIHQTSGWCLVNDLMEELERYIKTLSKVRKDHFALKSSFGTLDWKEHMKTVLHDGMLDSIELIGVCTDICVVSNALILKAMYPEVPITVDARGCAGTTPEKHKAALSVMESCQIKIVRDEE